MISRKVTSIRTSMSITVMRTITVIITIGAMRRSWR
jgi:hypothetical protein